MNEPIGLSGLANAGSRRSTSVCVTSVTTGIADAALRQRVAERVLEHEADRALRVADRVLHRDRRHLAVGDLRAAQDEADLRPVAVRQHDVPAGSDHASRRAPRFRTRRRTGRRAPCARSSRISALPPTATTASGFWCHERLLSPRNSRASAFTAAVKHAIGAVVTPAPICPTPASRCAMPLLMTGSTPLSTTLRASMPTRGRGEVERRQGERRIGAERDGAHAQAVMDRIGRRAADELDDRRRRGHREAADAGGLGDRRIAEVGRGVGDRVAGKVEPVHRIGRRFEPGVAGAREAHAEVDAVARHRRHHRAARDARRRVAHRLARGHRQVEEEVVVAGDEGQRRRGVLARHVGIDQRRARCA